MYISSDGTKKDTRTMNFEHLVNAFAKTSREIFNSRTVEEYNKNIDNLQILQDEIFERINDFFAEKVESEGW